MIRQSFVILGWVLFGLMIALAQARDLNSATAHYLDHHVTKSIGMMTMHGSDPYAYRPLAWQMAGILSYGLYVGAGLPLFVGMIAFAGLLHALTLFLALALYRRMTSEMWAWIGMALLALALARSAYDSDLAFDTAAELTLYVATALCIWSGRRYWRWVAPLAAVAAVTRGTSTIFIPVLLLLAALYERDGYGDAGLAFGLWVAAFWGLRFWLGERDHSGVYGRMPGLELLALNVEHAGRSLVNLFATYGLFPLLALVGWRHTSGLLRWWAVVLVPLWLAGMAWWGVYAETRLFLVPFALVAIPMMMMALAGTQKTANANISA